MTRIEVEYAMVGPEHIMSGGFAILGLVNGFLSLCAMVPRVTPSYMRKSRLAMAIVQSALPLPITLACLCQSLFWGYLATLDPGDEFTNEQTEIFLVLLAANFVSSFIVFICFLFGVPRILKRGFSNSKEK